MAAKKRKVDTWKNKKWYEIVAPQSFEEKPIGETFASDPKELIGRRIIVTLGELSEKRAQHYVCLIFKINDVKGEKAYTKIVGHALQRGYVGRQTRRMKAVIRIFFLVKTKDELDVEVQALCLAKNGMNLGQQKAVRKKVIEVVAASATKEPFEKFFQEMVTGKLSEEVYAAVRKVFPITKAELTKSRLKSEK
jgi:small subunit ribosomal protein S3Ae